MEARPQTTLLSGNPATFALESFVLKPFAELGERGLGYFVIHINGHCYGVRDDDATLLACSLDVVNRRINSRGTHTVPFAFDGPAYDIAEAFYRAIYGRDDEDSILNGLPAEAWRKLASYRGQDIIWAPDGDEAFDDSSYVLQFEEADQVRIIAFRSATNPIRVIDVQEVVLGTTEFYDILTQWRDAFESQWRPLVAAAKREADPS